MPKTDVSARETVDLENLTPMQLRELQTPQDLLRFYEINNLTVQDITAFGDGFPVLLREAKNKLVGKAFHIISWKQFDSKKYFVPGVMVWIMTETVDASTGEYERYRIVDLSTGIARQLIEDIAVHSPIRVPGGLLRSEYDTEIEGKTIHGVTYYLDTTPVA